MPRGARRPPFGPLALCLMLASYADALALSRPALRLQRREPNILSHRALVSQQRALVRMQEPTAPSDGGAVPGTPGDSMRKYFNEVMPLEHKKSALFSSWETYAAWLPVRLYSVKGRDYWLRLHNLKHWASEADVGVMVDQITGDSEGRTLDRRVVRYLSAPSGSGKTKSVLPAFYAGRRTQDRPNGFTHYIPIAFANNNNRNFRFCDEELSTRKDIAKAQGAWFMYDCIKTILEEPHSQGPYQFSSDPKRFSNPSNCEVILKNVGSKLQQLLEDHLGPDFYALIHLDEHRKMCDREVRNGAAFSAGAMQAIADMSGVVVVATYTAPPDGLLPERSSGTCRGPVALPPLDPIKLIADVPELKFPDPPGPEAALFLRRLWGTLQFRLMFCLQERVNGLHVRGSDDNLEGFLKAYHQAATTSNSSKADRLRACIDCCVSTISTQDDEEKMHNVSRLLRGVKDGNGELGTLGYHFPRQVNDLVVLPDGRISGSLRMLLAKLDPELPVYAVGAQGMKWVLTKNGDLLSRTPLEEAYTWTLACRAAIDKVLAFNVRKGPVFSIKGTDLKCGRIFPRQDKKVFTFDQLVPDVIYYADEPGRVNATCHDSHPRADIFFRTTKDEVVLIDITGSGGKNVAKKEQKLFEVLGEMQTDIDKDLGNTSKIHHGVTVHGVVLAPFDMEESTEQETDSGNWVMVVRGEKARQLLGGLTQVLRWFEENDSGASV